MKNLKIQEKEQKTKKSFLPIAVKKYLLRHWDFKKEKQTNKQKPTNQPKDPN